MKSDKSPETAVYMLKHLLTANITDPLSNESRGFSTYEQYFSGTGEASQINYLERKPSTGGRFQLYLDGVEQVLNTDYTLNRSTMRVTWTGETPPDDTDNIMARYQCVKPWIYDDDPNANMVKANYPRITVEDVSSDYQTMELGEYQSYASNHGNFITMTANIKIRNHPSNEFYTYNGVHYKNIDLLHAVSKEITDYFNENRFPMPWKFFDWEVLRNQRRREEEENDILRKDVTIKVKYFDNG